MSNISYREFKGLYESLRMSLKILMKVFLSKAQSPCCMWLLLMWRFCVVEDQIHSATK